MKSGSLRLVEIAGEIRTGLKPDERMSFVSGNFNVLHPGHLRLLKFAAEISDKLVVGVNPDDAPGVTMPSALRLCHRKSGDARRRNSGSATPLASTRNINERLAAVA